MSSVGNFCSLKPPSVCLLCFLMQINETILGFSLSLSKQAAESHMLEKSALLHCKMAFVRCKILASLLPCLLLSWPWVSQDQTMTQVLRPDC